MKGQESDAMITQGAHQILDTPGFPAFRSGRLIKVSKKAFFDWMGKGGLQQER